MLLVIISIPKIFNGIDNYDNINAQNANDNNVNVNANNANVDHIIRGQEKFESLNNLLNRLREGQSYGNN